MPDTWLLSTYVKSNQIKNNGSLKKHPFNSASPGFPVRDNRGSDETLLQPFCIFPTWWRAVGWTGGWREPGRPSPTPASTGRRGHSSLRGSAGTSREPSWLWSGPSWKPAGWRKETRVRTEWYNSVTLPGEETSLEIFVCICCMTVHRLQRKSVTIML